MELTADGSRLGKRGKGMEGLVEDGFGGSQLG